MTSSSFFCGLLGRCPRCGKGKLFHGLLAIMDNCPHCHASFTKQDSGDGPVFFVLVLVGFLVVGCASWVEIRYQPPFWIHAALWIPFTLIASIAGMRFFKAWLIAMQYKYHPEMFE